MRAASLFKVFFAGMSAAVATAESSDRPKAFVYRGSAACDGCPESVGHLLKSSAWNFEVQYVGPDEDTDITIDTLKGVTVIAFPGGPDLDTAWDDLKQYKGPIRNFVSSGGKYLGFCLGAYLAGYTPGFGLLPRGADTDSEIDQKNAQVKSAKDTIIQVNWTYESGNTENDTWLYFQEGAVITGLSRHLDTEDGQGRILATYSSNDNVAASVTPFGQGWVGLVGPHPEATKDWYSAYNISNPDGVSLRTGYDFVNATLHGGKLYASGSAANGTSTPSSNDPSTSSFSSAAGRGSVNPLARLINTITRGNR